MTTARRPSASERTLDLFPALKPKAPVARVVHCKREEHDVYVGRPSDFGNPYSHKEGTLAKYRVATVEEAVEKYEAWLRAQPELVARVRKELRGRVLGCWCEPDAPCHAKVLARIAHEEDPKPAASIGVHEGGMPPRDVLEWLPWGCPAEGCFKDRLPPYAMCTHHWFQVPDAIRDAVWRLLHSGHTLDAPSPQLEDALRRAVLTIARPDEPPSRGPLSKQDPPVLKKSKPLEEAIAKIVVPKKQRSSYDPRAHGALCDQCPANGRPVVPPTLATNDKPTAIVVGMEPGLEEIRQGKSFVGLSGKKLDRVLDKQKILRHKLHVTNAALCLPLKEEDRTKAYRCCQPRLQAEINRHPKTVPVITLGAAPLRFVYGKRTVAVTRARGFAWTTPDGRELYPTIHPAFVLRDAVQSPLWQVDWNRIGKRLRDGQLAVLHPPNCVVPRTVEELHEALRPFKDAAWLAYDVETTRDKPTVAELQCIGISDGEHTVVVPWVDSAFAPILSQLFKTRSAVGHNIFAFDAIVSERYGIHLPKIEDTLILHHAFASHFRQAMEHLVSVYLDAIPWKAQLGLNDERGQPRDGMSEEDLIKYNSYDAYYQAKLWIAIQRDLAATGSLYTHDSECADISREMTEAGIYIDTERRLEVQGALNAKIDRLFTNMKRLAQRDFGPNKTADIRDIVFKHFGARVLERSEKTGLPSTSKRTLHTHAVKVDTECGQFCRDLIAYRLCTKVLATHVLLRGHNPKKPKQGLLIETDGRVHPGWKSFGTPTGRVSVKEPNVNAMKRADKRFKGEPEYRIREFYVPAPGNIFVAFDLEQIEPRMSAYLSGDPEFIAAVETGDIHTAVAQIVFGDLPELKDSKTAKEIGKYYRQISKSLGLAVSYAAGADTLHQTLVADGFDIPFSRVVAMLDKLHRRFHHYFVHVDDNLQFCRENGYIVAGFMSGRKRWLGHAPEPQKIANTPCQGGAADVINYRMIELRKRLRKKYTRRRVKIVAQVYDSLIVECPKALGAAIEADMRAVMDEPYVINGRTVRLPIELKSGYRWSEV